MKTLATTAALLALVGLGGFSLMGCEESPFERTNEAVEDYNQEVGEVQRDLDAAEREAAEDLGEAQDDLQDDLDDIDDDVVDDMDDDDLDPYPTPAMPPNP